MITTSNHFSSPLSWSIVSLIIQQRLPLTVFAQARYVLAEADIFAHDRRHRDGRRESEKHGEDDEGEDPLEGYCFDGDLVDGEGLEKFISLLSGLGERGIWMGEEKDIGGSKLTQRKE